MTAIARTCQFCDRPFLVERAKINKGYGKFCSRECYHLSTRKKITKTCKFCGRQFETVPSNDRRGGGKFCSRKCSYGYKAAHVYVQRVCGICGKTFQILCSWVRKGGGAYCSRACRDKAQEKERILKRCEHCGKKFSVYPYVEQDDTRGRFCSNTCKYLWLSHHLHGENSHLWCGGTSEQEYGPGWCSSLKAIVHERDDHKCVICWLAGNIVHHIDYSKDNHDLGNLITLCPICHGKTNHHRDYWSDVLSDLVHKRQQHANV